MHYSNVIITGTGIHSCLGTNMEEFTAALRSGKCGLHHDEKRKAAGYQSDLCGDVPPVDEKYQKNLSPSQWQALTPVAKYALSAVTQALEEAEVTVDFLHKHNVSLIVSNDSTAEAMAEVVNTMKAKHDTRYLGTGAVFRSLNSTVSMVLASILGIHGLSLTVSAACAGGGHALGLARSLLASEQTEMAIVVGAQESGISAMQSFDALGIFAQEKVIPFGEGEEGLAPSGGAACVIMERNINLHYRSSHIRRLARLSGYGFSTNGINMITPSVEWEVNAMRAAIMSAYMPLEDIDAILAHATGTLHGDRTEAAAIAKVFPGMNIPVVATKGLTGHECWMAGVSQAVQCVVMLWNGFLPGTGGSSTLPLDIVTTSRKCMPNNILCNCFGFGGTNSSFIISRP